jgi:hypothetical protein
MAAPLAATALTISQISVGSPGAILQWSHTGVNLNRFEIKRRRAGSTDLFVTHAIRLATDLLYSTGTPNVYRLRTASGEAMEWVVTPLDSTGLRPVGINPTVSTSASTFPYDGCWLMPLVSGTLTETDQAWIGAQTPGGVIVSSRTVFEIPTRRVKISQRGVMYADEGTISGDLMDMHSQTADVWLQRLRTLMDNQQAYSNIYLVSPRIFRDIELGDASYDHAIRGGRAWTVSVAWREVS